MDALVVFVAQFVQILMHGLQSQTVCHGHKAWAAVNSIMLGAVGFHITATIAAHRGEEFGLVWFAYVTAGPLGIVASMILFSKWRKK